jgi:Ca2+/H+ antiporter, TMEM165/GDT1 family
VVLAAMPNVTTARIWRSKVRHDRIARMIDPKILATAFSTVFLAELGDKTQLATLTLASSSRDAKLAVFVGSALALVLTSALAVAGGEAISRFVNPVWLRRSAGLAFIVLGGLYLLRPGE